MQRLPVLLALVGMMLGLLGTAPCGHCAASEPAAKCHKASHHDAAGDRPASPADCGCLSHDLACSPSRAEVAASATIVDARPLVAALPLHTSAMVAHHRLARVDGRASPPPSGLPVYLALHALLI